MDSPLTSRPRSWRLERGADLGTELSAEAGGGRPDSNAGAAGTSPGSTSSRWRRTGPGTALGPRDQTDRLLVGLPVRGPRSSQEVSGGTCVSASFDVCLYRSSGCFTIFEALIVTDVKWTRRVWSVSGARQSESVFIMDVMKRSRDRSGPSCHLAQLSLVLTAFPALCLPPLTRLPDSRKFVPLNPLHLPQLAPQPLPTLVTPFCWFCVFF